MQRIVAAIPNYNMGPHAVKLAARLLEQPYDHVYILDDKSSDGSGKLAETLKDNKRFTFVAGKDNIGAGPNRNRILDYEKQGIVHFMDADMTPTVTDMVAVITKAFARHKDAAIIGMRVKNPDGSQYEFNYGTLIRLPKDAITSWTWDMHQKLPKKLSNATLKKLFGNQWKEFWTKTYPEGAENEHQVEATVECHMAVKLEDFAKTGGFTPGLRFHEIMDFATRLQDMGKTIWYVPEGLAIKHDHGDVRSHRNREKLVSAWKLMRDKEYRRHL